MLAVSHIRREKLYWFFQGSGWVLFFLVQTIITGFFTGYQWEIYARYMVTISVGFILTHIFREYIKKQGWIRLSMVHLAIHVVLASLLIGMIWSLIIIPINSYYFPVAEDKPITILIIIAILFNLSFVILVWCLIYFIFQLFINFKQSEIDKWQLEAAVKNAELIALKSQINPHFIFNSLNNIRSLVIENPEKARDMITHLSGLLRYSIQFNNKERVSLEDELEIVQNYLNLESIQYEDRLKYKLEIKPETLDLKIPPMAIQLLVENAIKHGISNLPEGGHIHIRSSLVDDELMVEVINSGQLKEGINGTGIGLKNASDRLKLLFGKLSNLTIRNMDEHYVSAKFSIPLNQDQL